MKTTLVRTARVLLAATCLIGGAAHAADDPATSPFAADRYDYSVFPPASANASAKASVKPARPVHCPAAATACQPSR
ncbi:MULTISPECIES: hypothetical protein [unclassified Cupriavidus]|uniref:hypothetical protein n=1 Tax=unclassified Cupriavidus TaxID=2640874 RepID=UPI0010F6BFF6|nr:MULTISPECIES: hypothetical protein [unclassified Cupriavidus]MWL89217.1 hypothetical protein [Cupriavidus sp. SW-Y-13]